MGKTKSPMGKKTTNPMLDMDMPLGNSDEENSDDEWIRKEEEAEAARKSGWLSLRSVPLFFSPLSLPSTGGFLTVRAVYLYMRD